LLQFLVILSTAERFAFSSTYLVTGEMGTDWEPSDLKILFHFCELNIANLITATLPVLNAPTWLLLQIVYSLKQLCPVF
jgi:hypothetical protein